MNISYVNENKIDKHYHIYFNNTQEYFVIICLCNAISDKVIVMNNAVIAQEGSPKDLYNFPQNKFVANFIGDANVVKAEILNKQSNSYDLKIAEMNIKVQNDKDFEKKKIKECYNYLYT